MFKRGRRRRRREEEEEEEEKKRRRRRRRRRREGEEEEEETNNIFTLHALNLSPHPVPLLEANLQIHAKESRDHRAHGQA